ncbi:MAG: hypothetical protein ACP6IY_22095 [Promethearchaeia archaeon]
MMEKKDGVCIKIPKESYMNMSNEEKEKIGLDKILKIENDIKNVLKNSELEYHLIGVLSLNSEIKRDNGIVSQGILKPIVFLDMKPIPTKKSIKLMKDIINLGNKIFNDEDE